ncbi:MAG: FG-GAP repeat domain-containing protein [Gemmatimonadaceae bacterium]
MIPGGKAAYIFGNELFANRGGGKFAEVSDSLGVETYWPWGPSVEDLNADGWDDIFIAAGMNFPYRYAINSVLLNEGGRHFLPSEFVVGAWSRVRVARRNRCGTRSIVAEWTPSIRRVPPAPSPTRRCWAARSTARST